MTLDLLSFDQTRAASHRSDALARLCDWVENYLMGSHPELGRPGLVCPFTRLARKHDTIRLAICKATPEDRADVFAAVQCGYEMLDRIPATAETAVLRTVVIGFPNCNSEEGLALIHQGQRRHKLHAAMHFRMLGLMHPASEARGVWNPNFRPLRSPMPVLAMRYMVEQDAALIANHRLQWPSYCLKFGASGMRRIKEIRRSARAADSTHAPGAKATENSTS
jgi:hypothetical protein